MDKLNSLENSSSSNERDGAHSARASPNWSTREGRSSRQFSNAAETAAAEAERDCGDEGGPWILGVSIVRSCRMYAAQQRSSRSLPGGADTNTAAAYILGSLADDEVRKLLLLCSIEHACKIKMKAVERSLKGRVRAAISALNHEKSDEGRAENLAAVRICEVVANMLIAHVGYQMSRKMSELRIAVAEKDRIIANLQHQL
eukprot:IDg19041t1